MENSKIIADVLNAIKLFKLSKKSLDDLLDIDGIGQTKLTL